MSLAASLKDLIYNLEGRSPSPELLDRLHTFVYEAMVFGLLTDEEYRELFMPLARLCCYAIDKLRKIQEFEKLYDKDTV